MSIFSKIQRTHVKDNIFDLTHDKKLSGKMGKLIPTFILDCVPGDRISVKNSVMVRFAPLIAPVMHQVSVYCHFFFVPNRIVWPNWEKFITGGEDGFDNTVHPYIKPFDGPGIVSNSSLYDYMGVPTDESVGAATYSPPINALPFAAYNKIYNDYYRDQNLVAEVDDELTDGDNSALDLGTLRERAWQHDYFTSALPWTQKGPEAMLPLGDTAPIYAYPGSTPPTGNSQLVKEVGNDDLKPDEAHFGTDAASRLTTSANGEDYQAAWIDLNGSHYTDLSAATASTINELRRAFKLQEWLEKNARGGSRYIESIAVHFGVNSSDQRLQRPKFLGGSSTPVKISEVLQMSQTESTGTPQGNMSGHAVSVGSGDYVSHFAEEHGYIIGIMSIMPKTAYQQGIPRHLSKFDKFDYYWPEFAHIGEQAILNQEIYYNKSDAQVTNEATFGYTPRYSEYKYINDSVHGDFRESLDFWHLGRKFSTRPALNSDFIEMDSAETDRIFAVEDESDNMWCHIVNQCKAKRKMPVFGTPKF